MGKENYPKVKLMVRARIDTHAYELETSYQSMERGFSLMGANHVNRLGGITCETVSWYRQLEM